MISAEALTAAYTSLTTNRKISFLSRIAYELTISGRMHGEESDPYARQVLIGINQLQHHLSSEIGHLINDVQERYPDDALMVLLVEKATGYGVEQCLDRAVKIATSRIIGNA